MGFVVRIVQRCGAAVAALLVVLPTTTGAAPQPPSVFGGNVACLSDEQRSELMKREMTEFAGAQIDLIQARVQNSQALSLQAQARAALRKCEQFPPEGSAGANCNAERHRAVSTDAEVVRTSAEVERSKAELPAKATARIDMVRAEYPACDSR